MSDRHGQKHVYRVLRSKNLAVASLMKGKTRSKWLYCDDNFRLGFRTVGHQHTQQAFWNLNFHFLFPKSNHVKYTCNHLTRNCHETKISVLLVLSEFLTQKKETRKVEEIKLDKFSKYLYLLNEKMEMVSSH